MVIQCKNKKLIELLKGKILKKENCYDLKDMIGAFAIENSLPAENVEEIFFGETEVYKQDKVTNIEKKSISNDHYKENLKKNFCILKFYEILMEGNKKTINGLYLILMKMVNIYFVF